MDMKRVRLVGGKIYLPYKPHKWSKRQASLYIDEIVFAIPYPPGKKHFETPQIPFKKLFEFARKKYRKMAVFLNIYEAFAGAAVI